MTREMQARGRSIARPRSDEGYAIGGRAAAACNQAGVS